MLRTQYRSCFVVSDVEIPMRNLVCISHPEFDGQSTPNLLCKACCSIYVSAIKQEQKASAQQSGTTPAKASKKEIEQKPATFRPTEWLMQKSLDSQR